MVLTETIAEGIDLSRLTPGQEILKEAILTQSHRRIVWTGSVRQGKTVGAVYGMILHALLNLSLHRPNHKYILGGVTIEQVLRNQLHIWYDICDQLGLSIGYVGNPKHQLRVGGFATFYLFGGEKAGSERAMAGMAATSAYLDEAARLHPDFIQQVEYRCEKPYSLVVMTTNADSPYNYIKTDYVDRAGPETLLINSVMGENQHIAAERTQQYMDDNRGGSAYKRNILNVWAPNQGVVYPIGPEMVTDKEAPKGSDGRVWGIASMDVGAAGVNAALLFTQGPRGGQDIMVADELIHDGLEQGIISEEEFLFRLGNKWRVQRLIIPDDGVMMIKRARRMGFQVRVAKRADISTGIQAVNNALSRSRLYINHNCRYLLTEASAYEWDALGDKPVKQKDHACDALRYGVMDILPPVKSQVYAPRSYR